MSTRVIIAAAGPQKYWHNHLGVPTHLLKVPTAVDSEGPKVPILVRTVMQASLFADEVFVTIPDTRDYGKYMEALRGINVHVVTRMDRAYFNEYDSTKTLWNEDGRTVLMLGDVIFSEQAARIIGEYKPNQFKVFGRFGPSAITGTPYGEIFAASWWNTDNDMVTSANRAVRNAFLTNHTKKCDGWRILRYVQGTNLNRHHVNGKWFQEINDYTDDIDKPEDYLSHPMFRQGVKHA